jgi:MarR family transcriptional regulator, lower aerobic nicotinate degradation pathway regulator
MESNGFLIARIGSESHKRFVDTIAQWDLGMYQQAVLTTLVELTGKGPTSQKQLGDFVGIDPRNLVPVIDSLEERDLVKRLSDSSDRRLSILQLTAKGKSLAEKIRTAGQNLEEKMFACLSDKEKNSFHTLLLKLYNSLEDNGGKNGS